MTGASNPPCPICRRPSTRAYAPFCSRRCADVDLQRWFSGSYVVPGAPPEDEETDAPDIRGAPGRDEEA